MPRLNSRLRTEVRTRATSPQSATDHPTRGSPEHRPRPLRGVGRRKAPPRQLLSCFGAPRGGAWEETRPGSAGRPGSPAWRHFRAPGAGQSGASVRGGGAWGKLEAEVSPRPCPGFLRVVAASRRAHPGRPGRLPCCLFRPVLFLLFSTPQEFQQGCYGLRRNFFSL